MWAQVKNGQVIEIYNGPKGLKIGNLQYPSGIFLKWSKSQLAEIGIYPVQEDRSNYKDVKHYTNTTHTYTFDSSNKVVIMSWGTPKEKDLTELKKLNKTELQIEAYNLLSPTDWYVIKASEVSDYSLPSNISKFRAAVRLKCNSMESQIEDASDVEALIALFKYTVTGGTKEDPVSTRPLGEFPKLEDY